MLWHQQIGSSTQNIFPRLILIYQRHRIRQTRKYQKMKYFARINRKPHCLYVGGSHIYSSSSINLSLFQVRILKTSYPTSSNKPGFCHHFFDFYYHYWHHEYIYTSSATSMARKIIMLVCMDKKGKSRKIIALTP